MSRLEPVGTLLEERESRRVSSPAFSPLEAATGVSAAPLWMAFRDRYTRAKGRRQLEDGAWILADEPPPCP